MAATIPAMLVQSVISSASAARPELPWQRDGYLHPATPDGAAPATGTHEDLEFGVIRE